MVYWSSAKSFSAHLCIKIGLFEPVKNLKVCISLSMVWIETLQCKYMVSAVSFHSLATEEIKGGCAHRVYWTYYYITIEIHGFCRVSFPSLTTEEIKGGSAHRAYCTYYYTTIEIHGFCSLLSFSLHWGGKRRLCSQGLLYLLLHYNRNTWFLQSPFLLSSLRR